MASSNDGGGAASEGRHMNDTTMPPPPPRRQPGSMNPPAPRVPSTTGPRQKKGLRKGFGLHDWALLTKSAKDLAQRKGAPLRQITKQELRLHSSIHDGWCSLKGKVYNISPYLAYHPGGEAILEKILGRDATALFEKYHRWVNIDGLIGTLQLGYLDTSTKSSDDNNKTAPPVYLTQPKKQDEFAVPAPVITKTKAKKMTNIMPKPKERDEDQIEEDYTEPWEETKTAP